MKEITLFIFGGVAEMDKEPPSPQSEFLMALAGPVSSVLLALGFWLLSLWGGTNEGTGIFWPAATALVGYLASINGSLALFNILPAFPLDGGRVLRSILWAANGNLQRATRWAARAGQAIAWLMIIGGIAMTFGAQIPFFGTGLGGGLHVVAVASDGDRVQRDHRALFVDKGILRVGEPHAAKSIPVDGLCVDDPGVLLEEDRIIRSGQGYLVSQ
mgnify:CR=1 FL=1